MHFDEKDWIIRWLSFLLLFKWKSEVWSSQSRWWVHQHSNQKCGFNAHGHAGWMKSLSNLGIVHKYFNMVSITGLNSSITGQLVQLVSNPCFTTFSRLPELVTGKMKAPSTCKRPSVPPPFWRAFLQSEIRGFCLCFMNMPSWPWKYILFCCACAACH